jgi:hypothetical protein
LACAFGLELLEQSDLYNVCGKVFPPAYKGEIARAVELNIPSSYSMRNSISKVRKLVTRHGGDKSQVTLHPNPAISRSLRKKF